MSQHSVSPEDVLRYAYKYSARSHPRIAAIQSSGHGTNPEDTTQQDKIVQSVMILSTLKQLSLYQRYAIELHLSHDKETVRFLAAWYGKRASRELGIHKRFAIDCARAYNNQKTKQSLSWWADKLHKTKSSTFRLKNKVLAYIETYEKHGLNDLEVLFEERGYLVVDTETIG